MNQITLTSTAPNAPYVVAPVGVGPALAVAITAAEKAIGKLDRRQETACKENNRARDLSALFGPPRSGPHQARRGQQELPGEARHATHEAAIQRAEDGARSYSLASFPVLDAKASE